MSPDIKTPGEEAVLRTLSPALRALEKNLRAWLDGPHRYPLSTISRATLEGLTTDLRRRAFAFVLNKWDRCLHAFTSGVRPDEDLLRDLKNEGFDNPLLFRTCAQKWVDYQTSSPAQNNGKPPGLPDDEQTAELIDWL